MSPGRPPPGSTPDVLTILDAVYALDREPNEWLRCVAESMLPSVSQGVGIQAYFVNLSAPERVLLESPIGVGLVPEWNRVWRENWWDVFMAPVDAATMRWMHSYSVCSHARELWDAGATRSASYAEYLARLAAEGYGRTHARYLRPGQSAGDQRLFYPDSFNVIALDATGRGAAFIVNLPEPTLGPVSPTDVALWGRLVGHMTSAMRLLWAQTQRPAGTTAFEHGSAAAECILDPTGRVHYAVGAARAPVARETLRQAALAVDRARTRKAIAREEALSLWQAMTAGRWNVVDAFDRDGRRYFLARPNTPATPPDTTLTPREVQVMRYAALGHGNKTIGYELGLSAGTVSKHLALVARKLGARNRIELIRAWQARTADESGTPDD